VTLSNIFGKTMRVKSIARCAGVAKIKALKNQKQYLALVAK
jgi:hypothetical protein